MDTTTTTATTATVDITSAEFAAGRNLWAAQQPPNPVDGNVSPRDLAVELANRIAGPMAERGADDAEIDAMRAAVLRDVTAGYEAGERDTIRLEIEARWVIAADATIVGAPCACHAETHEGHTVCMGVPELLERAEAAGLASRELGEHGWYWLWSGAVPVELCPGRGSQAVAHCAADDPARVPGPHIPPAGAWCRVCGGFVGRDGRRDDAKGARLHGARA